MVLLELAKRCEANNRQLTGSKSGPVTMNGVGNGEKLYEPGCTSD